MILLIMAVISAKVLIEININRSLRDWLPGSIINLVNFVSALNVMCYTLIVVYCTGLVNCCQYNIYASLIIHIIFHTMWCNDSMLLFQVLKGNKYEIMICCNWNFKFRKCKPYWTILKTFRYIRSLIQRTKERAR